MVTIRDVAKEAGVSQATVSFSLRHDPRIPEPTAERVREAARRIGYMTNLSARQLRSGRSGVIGIDIFELGQPQPSQMAAAFTDAAHRHGVQAIVQQTSNQLEHEIANLESVSSRLCDGTFFSPGTVTNEQILRVAGGKTIVLLNDYSTEPVFDSVFTPCVEGSRQAVNHLFDQGCRRVLMFGSDYLPYEQALVGKATKYRRLAGALEAFRDRGSGFDPTFAVDCEWNLEDARRVMLHVLDARLDFDGVYCMTDTVAMGAMRALWDRGLVVPDDVLLVGFDGVRETAYCTPSISTVCVDLDDLAEKAVRLLLDGISGARGGRGSGGPVRLTAGFNLVRRESTSR